MVRPPPDPMKALFEVLSKKGDDGVRYLYWPNQGDLEYLYEQGFVDTDQYTLAQWIGAFKDSRLPDGSYRMTEAQWLAKRPFRFSGPTGEPFNPLSIHEGAWTPEEIKELIETKLIPSTSLQRSVFDKMLEKGKEMGRFIDGKYIITKPFKFGLKQLLDAYPSPRRRRELAVAQASEKMGRKKQAATPVQPHGPATGYAAGPAPEKTAADRLSDLLWKGRK